MKDRKFDYFRKFSDMAQKASQAADLLQITLGTYDGATLREKTDAMKRIENDCDQIMHDIMNRLAVVFLPPIEREDIIEITDKLDTVVDSIEEILLGLYMYRVRELIPETLEFVDLIVESTSMLEEVVLEFSNFKRSNEVKEKIIRINSMRSLFDYTGEFDPRKTIIWKEMLQVLENCLDSIEECANEFETAMLKNG